MSWPKIIYYTAMALALLASLRGYNQRKYVLFIPLLALSLLVELTREVTDDTNSINAALSLFIAVEYTLLSLIISNFLYSQRTKRLIRYSILVLVPVFLLIQIKLSGTSYAYKYLDLLIAAPFLCIWTILYLYESAMREEEVEVSRDPMFWISLGNLLFFSGSFFSYGFGNYMVQKGELELSEIIFWIARILNILLYIMYIIGFLCLPPKK
jgi:hypothetical protein